MQVQLTQTNTNGTKKSNNQIRSSHNPKNLFVTCKFSNTHLHSFELLLDQVEETCYQLSNKHWSCSSYNLNTQESKTHSPKCKEHKTQKPNDQCRTHSLNQREEHIVCNTKVGTK